MSVEVTLDASSVPPANHHHQQQQQQQQQQQENPFQEDGELRRKADYIISHSRISRTEVQIVDPDSPQPTTMTTLVTPSNGGHGTLTEEVEAPVERSKVTEVHSNPPVAVAAGAGGAANGSVQDPVTVVEVEVKSAETKTDDRPQTAEQVKLKSKKKCCSVQ